MRAGTSYSRTRDTVLRRRRRTTLTTRDGQQLTGLHKRGFPGKCELCYKIKGRNGQPVRLEYHHWLRHDPSLGIWLCRQCHVFCEYLDRLDVDGLIKRYQQLFKAITSFRREQQP